MKKILVIGDTILDKYIYLDTVKISDEAPVITHNINKIKYILGGAGNVARNVSALGFECDYLGLEDQKELFLKKLFDENNVKCTLFNVNNSVPIKTRVISRNQQISRFDTKNYINISDDIWKQLYDFVDKNIQNYNVVIFSKYFDGFLEPKFVNYVSNICKKNNIFTLIDNRQNNSHEYKNINLLKLNFNEFSNAIKKNILNETSCIIDELKKLYSELDYEIITVTRAEKEVITIKNNKIFVNMVKRSDVVDVSGAGDTFVATFASFYNYNIDEIIDLCIKSSTISVSKLGTAVTYRHELIEDNSNLVDILKFLKKENKKIVLTNGVFDIIHPGHIKLLKIAKEQGDFLIVGLNSDKSTKILKGDERPINNENDRKSVIESIRYVDYAIIFDETTADFLIKKIQPDVYVKGGDYSLENLPEKNSLKENTIVKFIDVIHNKSTTNIIKKIKNNI